MGYKKPLEQDEIPDIDGKDSAGFLSSVFDESLKHVKDRDGTINPSVYKAIYLFVRKKAAINALFAVISAVASYVGPYLINDLVDFLDNKKNPSLKRGYLIALGFLGAKVLAQQQWIFGARQLGLLLRAALISHIYQKGLLLSSRSRQSHSSGEIINYMNVDIQRITDFRVLAALATFRMLQDPIFNLPELLNVIAQAKVSTDRIASYLQEEEIQSSAIEFVPKDDTLYAIDIVGGNFSWDPNSRSPTLDEIQLKVKRGMKVAICGTVGSGKSSMLSSITGEMKKLSGSVKISGSKAYVPQSPWILTGNIRENILFGNPYDNAKYERTIKACALEKDFELFACGDLTEIGERGINMSGGQKKRIQTARAVYQDADIYLLDDPFSAVDAHTGTQLFRVMKNGRIAQVGSFKELLTQNIGFEVLGGAHSQALQSILTFEISSKNSQTDESHNSSPLSNVEPKHLTRNSDGHLSHEITEKGARLIQDEERERGSIGKEVYKSYLTIAKGGIFVPPIILAQSSFQVLQIASNYWMAWACPTTNNAEPIAGMNFVLLIYVLPGVGSSLCVLA
ncbi:hypothetical protein Ancab_037593 [Ancistrocladus abbreviatus]